MTFIGKLMTSPGKKSAIAATVSNESKKKEAMNVKISVQWLLHLDYGKIAPLPIHT